MQQYSAAVQDLTPVKEFPEEKRKLFEIYDERLQTFISVTQIECENIDIAIDVRRRLNFEVCHQHPNISQYFNAQIEQVSGRFFLYDLCEKIEQLLSSDIEARAINSRRYLQSTLMRYLLGIVSACSYLQTKGIAMRNISPEHLMLDSHKTLKIINFQRSKQSVEAGPISATLFGSGPYLSPEVRRQQIKGGGECQQMGVYDTFKSDVYSLGCVMMQLSLLELPNLTDLRGLEVKINDTLKIVEKLYSEKWANILKTMAQVKPESRPNFHELQECLQTFIPQSGTVDIVCLVDESGSTFDGSMDYTKLLLNRLLEEINPQHRMALIGFSDTARVLCEFTTICTGREALASEICKLASFDETNLAAGCKEAARLISGRIELTDRCALIIFTDNNHCGEQHAAECEEALKAVDENENLQVCVTVYLECSATCTDTLLALEKAYGCLVPGNFDKIESVAVELVGKLNLQAR